MFLKLFADIDEVPLQIFELCSAFDLEMQEKFLFSFCRRWIVSKCLDTEFILINDEHLKV